MIQPERIQRLNNKNIVQGKYVLYWMQASQRVVCNHALEYAIREANERGQPVVVVFGITNRFPEANVRHYTFMLQGLREAHEGLEKRGIRYVVMLKSPEKTAISMAKAASLVVTDRGYLAVQKAWRAHVAQETPCLVMQVESDVIVPVEVASEKEAYGAGILRPKLHKNLDRFLVPLKETLVKRDSLELRFGGESLKDTKTMLLKMSIDDTVGPVHTYKGGTSKAMVLLKGFIEKK